MDFGFLHMSEEITCSCADNERSEQKQNHKVVRLNLATHAATLKRQEKGYN